VLEVCGYGVEAEQRNHHKKYTMQKVESKRWLLGNLIEGLRSVITSLTSIMGGALRSERAAGAFA
jgi:hypothetical protein